MSLDKCNKSSNCEICDPKSKYKNCICCDEWKKFNKYLLDIKNYKNNLILENLRISTITLCCNFNMNIDLEELANKYPYKNCGKFYNCLIFNWKTKYQHKVIVSVKIFPNGKVQIAGVNTIMSCAYIIRKIYKIIEEYPLEPKKKPTISDLKISMINSDFKINHSFNQIEFCKVLSENSINNGGNFTSIIYQPVKYPAINAKIITKENTEDYINHNYKFSHKKKYPKAISVLIFRSGSIIITGGNSIKDYHNVYKYLIELIDNSKDKILIKN